MGELIPANKDEPQEMWPTTYWPDNATNVKYTDELLATFIQEFADTNDSPELICRRNGIAPTAIGRLRNKLPDFSLAYELAKAHRNDRLNNQILEIADEPVDFDNPEFAKLDMAHRKLKIAAREKVIKGSAGGQKKGIDKFTVNIDGDAEGGPAVNIQVINYGDHK